MAIVQDNNAAEVDPVLRNENGPTAEEQAAYTAYYTRKPEYDPDQIIARADRKFGIVQKDNPFLMGYPDEDNVDDLRLGQVNMICVWLGSIY